MADDPKRPSTEAETNHPSTVQHHYHYHYLQGTRWLWLLLVVGLVAGLVVAVRAYEQSPSEPSTSGALPAAASIEVASQVIQ